MNNEAQHVELSLEQLELVNGGGGIPPEPEPSPWIVVGTGPLPRSGQPQPWRHASLRVTAG